MALTPSEALVERLCKSSFLSLWSYPNPRASTGKELCDLLVVCDPHVIIFSVKEIGLADASDEVAVARWRKKAVEQSVKQLYGAERLLSRLGTVTRADGTAGFVLPPNERRHTHRIAVALGSGGLVDVDQGDFGKGFVHVLDDSSLAIVMSELDTITDFAEYLEAKEALVKSGTKLVLKGAEPDLLAVYIHRGRAFTTNAEFLLVEGDLWAQLTSKPEWRARREADSSSYVWDALIERIASDVLGPGLEFGTADQAEESLRIMARENRFFRRILADDFNDFMAAAAKKEIRARKAQSPSGVLYVLLAAGHDEPREHRKRELYLRCVAARNDMANYAPIVGLATEQYAKGKGHSIDVLLFDVKEWAPELREKVQAMQKELGYWTNPRYSQASHDEFPAPSSSAEST